MRKKSLFDDSASLTLFSSIVQVSSSRRFFLLSSIKPDKPRFVSFCVSQLAFLMIVHIYGWFYQHHEKSITSIIFIIVRLHLLVSLYSTTAASTITAWSRRKLARRQKQYIAALVAATTASAMTKKSIDAECVCIVVVSGVSFLCVLYSHTNASAIQRTSSNLSIVFLYVCMCVCAHRKRERKKERNS